MTESRFPRASRHPDCEFKKWRRAREQAEARAAYFETQKKVRAKRP